MPDGSDQLDDDLITLLFEKIKKDYVDNGPYACKMLETAVHLLDQEKQAPMQGRAAAYCIRQAMDQVFMKKRKGSSKGDGLRAASSHVVRSKNRFENVKIPTDSELTDLYNNIDRMNDILNEGSARENRIRSLFRSKSGEGAPQGGSLIQAYLGLVDELNNFIHAPPKSEENDRTIVRSYYRRALEILTNISLPVQRWKDILRLARLPDPKNEDVIRLQNHLMSINDFELFAMHIQSPAWFKMLDKERLKPPPDDSDWVVGILARHIKKEHIDDFAFMLEKYWNDWVKSESVRRRLAFISLLLKERGLSFFLKLLRKDLKSASVCSHASLLCSKVNASNPRIEDIVDLLLKPDSGLKHFDRIDTIPATLINGMDLSSSKRRIQILAYKLKSHLERDMFRFHLYDTVAELDKDGPYATNALASHLRDALKKGMDLGNTASELVEWLEPLPETIKPRFVAWVYAEAEDADCSSLANFAVDGCSKRNVTGDDLALLDRLWRECDKEIVSSRLADAIGSAPDPGDIDEIWWQTADPEDKRRAGWAVAVGDCIELPGWKETLEALDSLKINRAGMRPPSIFTSIGPTSPLGSEDLNSGDPYDRASQIASWIPDGGAGLNTLSALGLSRDLHGAVKSKPGRWADDPVRMIKTLRHSTYIAAYFRGLSSMEGVSSDLADRLIRAVQLASEHPWPTVSLDPSPLEYDIDWDNSDMAGIDLLGSLARNDAQFNDESLSVAWEIVCRAAASDPRSEDGEDEAVDSKDFRSDTINNQRTNAMQVLLYLVSYAGNEGRAIPEIVPGILAAALRLKGNDGAEHRAIIACHVRLLRHYLPGWFELNEPFLFGGMAPGNLAQLSIDIHLKWEYPSDYVLERYKPMVLKSVRKGIENSVDCLLAGMFWKIDGYEPRSLAADLDKMGPEYLSLVGERSAMMLREETDSGPIRRGVDFWRSALDISLDPEAFAGFGMWAAVRALGQEQWESTTLAMCLKPGVRLDWAEEVAQRIESVNPITDAGLTILKLIVLSNLEPDSEVLTKDRVLNVWKKSKEDHKIRDSRNDLRDALIDRGWYRNFDSS